MFKEQARFFQRMAIAADFAIMAVSLVLAYFLRAQFPGTLRPIHEYLWILALAFPVWFFLASRHRLYQSLRRLSFFEIVSKLLNVHLLGGIIVAACIYFLDRDQYSRGLYLAFLALSAGLLTLEKIGLRFLLVRLRRRGFNFRNILLVGLGPQAEHFLDIVENSPEWGLRVVGQIRFAQEDEERARRPLLGTADEVVDVCKSNPVDEVVFCPPENVSVDIESYLLDLEEVGITTRMVLNLYETFRAKRELEFLDGELPLLTFRTKTLDPQDLFLKRVLDIGGALTGLALTLVLLPWIALAVRLESQGPIFFGQKRVGENGRLFTLWKFRSMCVDAEERLSEVADRNEMQGAIFKLKNDPRITRVGHVLRRTSLDELPQFWNVLRGEMSLVGTRPPLPQEVKLYQNWQRRRISIKPGITGLWQVRGRGRLVDFDEIVQLDLKYIDNWSLWMDLRIILQTIGVVLSRRGSH